MAKYLVCNRQEFIGWRHGLLRRDIVHLSKRPTPAQQQPQVETPNTAIKHNGFTLNDQSNDDDSRRFFCFIPWPLTLHTLADFIRNSAKCETATSVAGCHDNGNMLKELK